MTEPSEKSIGKAMIIAAWLLLLGLLTLFFNNLLDEQYNPNQNLQTGITDQGVREIRLLQNRAGHYVTPGEINRHEVVFLLDTGATTISIPQEIANRIGLQRGAPMRVNTANGTIVVYNTRLDDVRMGDIQLRNVSANINPHMQGEGILMGMNVLKNLELIQRDNTLTIRQYP